MYLSQALSFTPSQSESQAENEEGGSKRYDYESSFFVAAHDGDGKKETAERETVGDGREDEREAESKETLSSSQFVDPFPSE